MDLVKGETGKLVFLGKNGTGKTHLGISAVKALGGEIRTMYEISSIIRESYTHRGNASELEIVGRFASIPLLVIDEIGRTKGSDAEYNWLSYIIDKRHVRRLPLILISNKHAMKNCKEPGGCKDCIDNYLSDDMISRISQDGKIIDFTWEDYRRVK
jgi:DNA replication protein DnaC